MRRFHSYGPVDCRQHFCVERQELVERCLTQLVGDPDKGGHYFTIWSPRQAGKTWLMRQMRDEIPQHYGDRFTVFDFSFGNLRGMEDAITAEQNCVELPLPVRAVLEMSLPGHPKVTTWQEFVKLFAREGGLWDRPLILLIDEVDTAPPILLDWIVGRFREMYLYRQNNWLHGLALIGVRAVLGIERKRGSPFNIQRSLHVPNFTLAEVQDLYQQYQTESGQVVDPAVVEQVYQDTNGQPGLVCWFGELLTEKYNPGPDQPIDQDTWARVWNAARFLEPNNTVLNLIAKARSPEYQGFLVRLFTKADIPFAFHEPLHSYLYLHGIIEPETSQLADGRYVNYCRFSSPFIQDTLYHAFSSDLVDSDTPLLALHPLDDLADVFADPTQLDLPALLRRYKEYLARLKNKGFNPWKEQPRRQTDMHLTEAVGHFHLYAWLQNAIGRRCAVMPEFPTGNGRVDLHIGCTGRRGIIEVKSFIDQYQAGEDRKQAAHYAQRLGFDRVTMAVFVPIEDESVLEKLSVAETINSVAVTVVAIGWT
ncbi:MAG: hypothetical protein DYG89_13530 [Caldilinea sp. CFX5]|nr:hypothetical protein [Caldilinea sp. CFX5]